MYMGGQDRLLFHWLIRAANRWPEVQSKLTRPADSVKTRWQASYRPIGRLYFLFLPISHKEQYINRFNTNSLASTQLVASSRPNAVGEAQTRAPRYGATLSVLAEILQRELGHLMGAWWCPVGVSGADEVRLTLTVFWRRTVLSENHWKSTRSGNWWPTDFAS